jgi:hypothetical protein
MGWNEFSRVLLSAWVAGPALIVTVMLIGGVHVVASIEDERTEARRLGLAKEFGREAAHATPSSDSLVEWCTYLTRGTLDAYLQGLAEGKAEVSKAAASPMMSSQAPDTGMRLDVLHRLSDGRTWRDVGIWHDRDSYDPQSSPHFLAAARASDAVLTEDGLYFDQLRATARGLGIPAGSLSETRTREAALTWPHQIARTSLVCLVGVAVALAGVMVWSRWKKHRARPLDEAHRPHVYGQEFLAGIALVCCGFAVPVVLSDVIGHCSHAFRHGPAPAASAVLPGIRGQADQLADAVLMPFDEACELDSRSMHRSLLAYMYQHPECRRLLVVTGSSHAKDIERYETTH